MWLNTTGRQTKTVSVQEKRHACIVAHVCVCLWRGWLVWVMFAALTSSIDPDLLSCLCVCLSVQMLQSYPSGMLLIEIQTTKIKNLVNVP